MYVVFSAAEGRRIDKVLTEQQHEHLELILVLIWRRASLLSGLQYTNMQLQKMRRLRVLPPLLICLDSPWRLH
jgi:hypothetical protein